MEAQRLRRRYDHRLQRLVHDTGNVELAVRHGAPRSTARDWTRRSTSEVVSIDPASASEDELRREVLALRARNAKLIALLRLTFVLLRVCVTSLSSGAALPTARRNVAFFRPSTVHEMFSTSESLCVSSAFRQRDTTRGNAMKSVSSTMFRPVRSHTRSS